jgi:hypothetical protein
MQAELNKYFYNDITNIISDYHYKTKFYEVIKEMTYFIKETTWLLDDDDPEDSEDEDDQFWEINNFRSSCFKIYKLRIRKIKRQNTMNEDDTDSEDEELMDEVGRQNICNWKKYNYYVKCHYSPEEFAYKIRYPEADDEDNDW